MSTRQCITGLTSCLVAIIAFNACGAQSRVNAQYDEPSTVGAQIDQALSTFFGSLAERIEHSMLLIIPDTNGQVILVPTVEFASDAEKCLKVNSPISIETLIDDIVSKSRKDVRMASNVFIIAQRDVDYEHLLTVVSAYESALSAFPNFSSLEFRITLWDSFENIEDLISMKNTAGSISGTQAH